MWQHEDFDKFNFTNDVSVLELDEPLEFNEFVKPLLLAEQGKGAIQNSFKFGFKVAWLGEASELKNGEILDFLARATVGTSLYVSLSQLVS